MRTAAVDIGTNSTRLLVADVEGDAVSRVLERQAIITRLGEGVATSKRLSEAAVTRTLSVLARYRQVVDGYRAERIRAVATSAAREAANITEFVSRVKQTTGWDLEILAGEDEARLMFLGATTDPKIAKGDAQMLVIDVGGGSTELVLGRPRRPEQVVSFNMGCVRLLEMFLTADPPRPEQVQGVIDFVARLLQSHWPAERLPIDRAVAVAGTPTALVAVKLGLVPYDPQVVHGSTLTRDDAVLLLNRLANIPLERRRQLPGLEPERADVIVPGAAILLEVMDFFGLASVVVSESDILDGIAIQASL